MAAVIKQQLKMATQAHPSHLYVRNKSPKATQGVMNPRVSSLQAPSVSGVWATGGERTKHGQIYSNPACTPLNPAPRSSFLCKTCRSLRIYVVTSHLSMPGEARPFRAPAFPRLFDYINTLICTYYVPSLPSERRRVFCLSSFYMKPLRWHVSVMCRAVMKGRRFWMVRWRFQTLGACVQGRGHPRFKGRFHDTPAIRQDRFTTVPCRQKEIHHI